MSFKYGGVFIPAEAPLGQHALRLVRDRTDERPDGTRSGVVRRKKQKRQSLPVALAMFVMAMRRIAGVTSHVDEKKAVARPFSDPGSQPSPRFLELSLSARCPAETCAKAEAKKKMKAGEPTSSCVSCKFSGMNGRKVSMDILSK